MFLTAMLVCTLALAEDNAKIIRDVTQECYEMLDDMFFTNYKQGEDTSIQGHMKEPHRRLSYGNWRLPIYKFCIRKKINSLEDNEVKNKVAKAVEARIKENTKKLISLISYDDVPGNCNDASYWDNIKKRDEAIEMNYAQLEKIPFLLCSYGIRSEQSNCEEIYNDMKKFVDEIIEQRRKTEPADKF